MSKNMKYTEVREIVYRRYNGRCAICGRKLALEDMCISLITPKSKGGGKDFANMQAACEICAAMKNNLTQGEFLKKIFLVARHNTGNIVKVYVKGGIV